MKDDGFLSPLEGNLGLVQDAAAASLCLPSRYSLRALQSMHVWSLGDAETSLRKVNTLLNPRLGFPPFIESPKGFLPLSLI
jgi:hypothetical protein